MKHTHRHVNSYEDTIRDLIGLEPNVLAYHRKTTVLHMAFAQTAFNVFNSHNIPIIILILRFTVCLWDSVVTLSYFIIINKIS